MVPVYTPVPSVEQCFSRGNFVADDAETLVVPRSCVTTEPRWSSRGGCTASRCYTRLTASSALQTLRSFDSVNILAMKSSQEFANTQTARKTASCSICHRALLIRSALRIYGTASRRCYKHAIRALVLANPLVGDRRRSRAVEATWPSGQYCKAWNVVPQLRESFHFRCLSSTIGPALYSESVIAFAVHLTQDSQACFIAYRHHRRYHLRIP